MIMAFYLIISTFFSCSMALYFIIYTFFNLITLSHNLDLFLIIYFLSYDFLSHNFDFFPHNYSFLSHNYIFLSPNYDNFSHNYGFLSHYYDLPWGYFVFSIRNGLPMARGNNSEWGYIPWHNNGLIVWTISVLPTPRLKKNIRKAQ